MINIVNLEDLDAHIASTIQKVHDGVVAARKGTNNNVELPKGGIDFKILVVMKGGWQALESQTTEAGETLGDGTTKGTEKQTGYSTDTRSGTGTDTTTKSDEIVETGTNGHIQTEESTQKNYEAL
jgi:hypothetical protein